MDAKRGWKMDFVSFIFREKSEKGRKGGVILTLRSLHLGHQNKEHEMPSIAENGIRDGNERRVEACRHGHIDLSASYGIRASTCHANDACNHDRDDGGDAEP